ncbi:methyltransferase N6AMT1 [Condylostylus longicornis]|uniref:methyltransferase N6AMT1 n=1 Tax=Condylostylus longicornis TaxID=2530218 RepID=UPI00244DD7A4|nr:methyltransferase N6AMT1 [Condylostylus longicornis]
METPIYSHLTERDYENVYEPSEDTFLLLDAIENDLQYIENILQPNVCLEIGSGSGIIITSLAKRLHKFSVCLATDINNYACQMTKKTAAKNFTHVDAINTNLADCFRNNIFDLVIFNPPYVATSEEELENKEKNPLVFTWAGGTDGRLIIDLFLNSLPDILSKSGVAYLLLLKENKPHEIINALNKRNFVASKLMERRIPGERLCVIKIINR